MTTYHYCTISYCSVPLHLLSYHDTQFGLKWALLLLYKKQQERHNTGKSLTLLARLNIPVFVQVVMWYNMNEICSHTWQRVYLLLLNEVQDGNLECRLLSQHSERSQSS